MSNNRKKILVFADWFLPGYRAGGPIRSLANLVAALPEFDFFIVTRNTDHHSTESYAGIVPGQWTEHLSHVQVIYLEEKNITKKVLEEIIASQSFDWFYLNSLFSKAFTLLPLRILRRKKLQHKILLAPRGMLHPGAMSVKRWKKSVFMLAAKRLGWYKDISWHATSETEMEEIRKHFAATRMMFAPNLSMPVTEKKTRPGKKPGEMKLVSIARISAEKGILEALQFLKAADLSGIVMLDFYGTQQNENYLGQCESIFASSEKVRVRFHGDINPSEIPSVFSTAHFYYSATLGENFGHSIVEAMAYGVPVIISDRTPWRNLASKKCGWDLPLDEKHFSSQLQECLAMSNDEYQQFCDGAAVFGKEITTAQKSIEASRALFS